MAWRAFLARPAGTPNALTEPVADTGGVSWSKILSALQGPSKNEFDPLGASRIEYRMPDVLPGVRPTKMSREEVVEGDGGVVLAMDGGFKEQLATDDAMSAPNAWGFGV